MKSRVLLVVALLALLGLAHAGGKASQTKDKSNKKPKPAPKKPTVDAWCAKSIPAKCGSWANDKKVCPNDCPGGGVCTLKAGGKTQGGKCCTCVPSFDSDFCACGGKDATATYCSSAALDAANTCLPCLATICASACAAGIDPTTGYTYDGQLALMDGNALTCPQVLYTGCPPC